MEIQTSEEAYKTYQKLKDIEENVNKQNRGLSLLGSTQFKKSYFISVVKEVEINLLEKKERIVVETNIFGWRYGYSGNYSIKEFLEELKKYLATPSYKFLIQHNRRMENKIDMSWKTKFRTDDFNFDELIITLGEEAETEINFFDFVNAVRTIVDNKKEPTEKEQEDFEKFSYFCNRIEDLNRQFKSSNNSYSSYGQPRDNTLKISISKKEYNLKLKDVEKELLKLCKKYPFLEMPSIDYEEINVKKSFEDWKVINKDENEEDWDYLSDEDKEEYEGDFECYSKQFYEQYLEDSEFDE